MRPRRDARIRSQAEPFEGLLDGEMAHEDGKEVAARPEHDARSVHVVIGLVEPFLAGLGHLLGRRKALRCLRYGDEYTPHA